jgi:hypothetical protein
LIEHPQWEQNLFWETPIKWLNGTTNAKSKFIPVSPEALEDCHYKGSKDLLCMYLNNNENSELFTGKVFVWGSSQIYGTTTLSLVIYLRF